MSHPSLPPQPRWRTSNLVRAAVIALAVYYGARLFYLAHELLFLAFLGVLFGLAVSAGADTLARFRIPRALGVVAIVATFIGLLVGFFTWTGPTIRRQFQDLRQRLPEAFAKADQWIADREGGALGQLLVPARDTASLSQRPDATDTTTVVVSAKATNRESAAKAQTGTPKTTDSLPHLYGLRDRLFGSLGGGAKRFLFPVITSTFAVVTGIILILFLTIYIAVDPVTYRQGFLALVPRRSRQRYDGVVTAVSKSLRRWLLTQLVAMIVIGAVTTGALVFLDVRAALPLGIIAGLLEFIPTVGPILSAVPAVAMGFMDSPEKALIVVAAYIGIQFLENHLLIPILMKEGVDLPPVLTILTQALMALLFGFIGLFVAVPVLVVATVLIKKLYVEDMGGETEHSAHA